MAAGTTKAMRPPGFSRLAAATRNGAQDAVSPENSAPRPAHNRRARLRTSPLKVW